MDLKTFINTKIIIICILLCCTINKCLSITKILSVENDKVCSPIKKRHIHLNKYEPPAVVVKETRYFDNWLGDKEFSCKFKVEANSEPRFAFTYIHEPEGVFAVVDNFTLRMDDDGQCVDYIKFIQDSKIESRKICGKLSEMEWVSDQLSPFFAPNAFLDPSGHLDVVIYIARQKLKPGERIDFSIVFTSFKECSSRLPDLQSCKGGSELDSSANGHKYCISKELFNDGLVNCPFIGCKDEGGCKSWRNIWSTDDQPGTAATTLGALAVVVLVFACFLSVLWILRKLHILCWSAPRAAAAAPPPSPPPAVYFSGGSVHEMGPTAPPLPSPDKDPPPSYTSLFPPKSDES